MPRIVHFEIHADDPDRAIDFYAKLLDWKFQRWGSEEYWVIETGPENEPGINGGLVRRRAPVDGESVIAFVCTVDVPSVDDFASRLGRLGGAIAVPKMPVPGVGWLIYARDTEGNIFGAMERDPKAE